MPIYDYRCTDCDHRFEAFVRKDDSTSCPECGGGQLERFMATTALGTETTNGMAMRAARKRDARQANQMNRTQREYEEAHDDH